MKSINPNRGQDCEHYLRRSILRKDISEGCYSCHNNLFSICWFEENQNQRDNVVTFALQGDEEVKQLLHKRVERLKKSVDRFLS